VSKKTAKKYMHIAENVFPGNNIFNEEDYVVLEQTQQKNFITYV
jgi:hypothetical protein